MLLYCPHDENMSRQKALSKECAFTDYFGQEMLTCARIDNESLAKTWYNVVSLENLGSEIVDVYEVDDDEVIAFDTRKLNDMIEADSSWRTSLRLSDYSRALEVENPDETIYLLKTDFTAKRTWHFDLRELLFVRVDDFARQCNLDRTQTQHLRVAADRLNDLTDESMYYKDNPAPDRVTSDDFYPMFVWSGFFVLMWSTVTGKPFNSWFLTLFPYHFRQTKGMERYESLAYKVRSEDDPLPTKEEQAATCRAFESMLNECAHLFAGEVASHVGVTRNDECLCGSAKKFKKCCARATMDEIADRWTDLPKR